jgi:PPOX class probable F420-dependent enzyme
MNLDKALSYARERKHGVLVTVKRDGRPQLSNIVHSVDDADTIRISVTDSRAKTRNLGRDSRVSLYVTQDDRWGYVVLEADAELSPVASASDDSVVDELVELYRALSGEHPDWDEYRQAMVDDSRLVIRLRPTHAYGMV